MRMRSAAVATPAVDMGLGGADAIRELESLRKEVVAELMSRPEVARFKRLALYVEAIDISLDSLMGKMRGR